MKKRRLAIIAFMFIAVLTLGIGFAALTVDLDINGSAELGLNPAFSEKVNFTTAVANMAPSGDTSQNTDTAGVNAQNSHKANFTVKSLKNAGDEATFTFTIKNTSDYDAIVTVETITNTVNATYFTVTTDVPDSGLALANTNGTATVIVTVKLNAVPASTELTGTFGIILRATTTEVVQSLE